MRSLGLTFFELLDSFIRFEFPLAEEVDWDYSMSSWVIKTVPSARPAVDFFLVDCKCV